MEGIWIIWFYWWVVFVFLHLTFQIVMKSYASDVVQTSGFLHFSIANTIGLEGKPRNPAVWTTVFEYLNRFVFDSFITHIFLFSSSQQRKWSLLQTEVTIGTANSCGMKELIFRSVLTFMMWLQQHVQTEDDWLYLLGFLSFVLRTFSGCVQWLARRHIWSNSAVLIVMSELYSCCEW